MLTGLAAAMIGLTSSAIAQAEFLNETLRDGTLPAGWSQTDINFQTAAGGYARFEELTSVLTTPVFDASGVSSVSVNFNVAKWGSGDDGPITVEYSVDGAGGPWTVAGNSQIPTGSDYIEDSITISASSATFAVRFSRADSPSRKRLRDLVISDPDAVLPLELTSLSPANGAIDVPTNTTLAITFNQPVQAGLGDVILYQGPSVVETFSASAGSFIDNTVHFTPSALLNESESYHIIVESTAFQDLDGAPFAGLVLDTDWAFTTAAPPEPAPVLDGISDYTQDFSTFVSTATLPTGWNIDAGEDNNYQGDWGTGTSNGWRGNASVLGFQHTGSTGTAIKTLTIQNTSGATITELFISYDGRVARATEVRNPIYSVTVDGNPAAALTYDTNEGDVEPKTAVVTGLSIVDGAFFEISWSSQRGGVSGSSKQIGISNLVVSLDIPAAVAPSVSVVEFVDPITQTGFGAFSGVSDEGSDPVTAAGFVIAETNLQPNPVIGDPNATVIDLFGDFETMLNFVIYDFVGLTPSTSYSVRFFATSAAGTTYSAAAIQSTVTAPTSLTAGGYGEDFLTFTGISSLPAGWSFVGGVTGYDGDWGSGSSGGFRGPADAATVGVLGYQHTGSTGTVTVNLQMTNDTGAEINALEVSYLGRVERVDQTRLPIWTFNIDGVEIPALSYSTADGIDKTVSTTLTGLSIGVGQTFMLSWSSDRGEPELSSRQIGIADVTVESVTLDVEPPVFTVAAGSYFEDQSIFISNFVSYDPAVEVRYTLDGTDPVVGVGIVYNDVTGILLEDGNGPVQLRAIAVDTGTLLVSPLVANTYIFPVDVADIAAFRAGTPGTLYRVSSEAVVLHRDGFRNRHYVRDSSGSLTIWDDNSPNLLTTDYQVGDGVTGFIGRPGLKNSNGLIAMDVAADAGSATSTGNATDPVVVTLDTLDLSRTGDLVRINGVTIAATGSFDTGSNYTINGPLGSTLLRTDFWGADYIGQPIPETTIDIIGIVGGYGSNPQITPRSLADFIAPDPPTGTDFASWIEGFNVGPLTGPSDDADGDGIPNILEHVLGLAPDVANNGSVVESSASAPGSIRFVHTRIKPDDLAGDAVVGYEWSANLVDWTADGDAFGGVTVEFGLPSVIDDTNPVFDLVEITATVTGGSTQRLFVRISADVAAAAGL